MLQPFDNNTGVLYAFSSVYSSKKIESYLFLFQQANETLPLSAILTDEVLHVHGSNILRGKFPRFYREILKVTQTP